MSSARLVLSALLGPPLMVGAGLCALVAALAELGRWSPTWDLFTHFAPLYLAVGLATVLVALVFTGRWRIAALSAGLACVFAAGLLMTPEYLRSTGPKAAPGARPSLKVVQFNAWDGAGGTARLAAWLDAERPDVVVVAEANRRIRDDLAQHGWWSVTGRSGVMLFTRDRPLATIVPTGNETGPMELIGVVVETAAGKATVLGLHAPWPTQHSLPRERQALMPIVRSYPSATTILAGDFNSTPWSFARRRDDRELGLIRRTRAVFTWPVGRHHLPFPVLPIDHVYAGSAWATVKVERGPPLGSDHYPVIVSLAPRAPS
jgi:endonuclease/exonuclease/phosphatase (EEP) superfamily protein YafD